MEIYLLLLRVFLVFLSCQSGTVLSPSPFLRCICSVSCVRSLLSSYFSESLLQQFLRLSLCSSSFVLTHPNSLLCSKSLTLARRTENKKTDSAFCMLVSSVQCVLFRLQAPKGRECFHYCSLVPSALIVLYKTLLIVVQCKGQMKILLHCSPAEDPTNYITMEKSFQKSGQLYKKVPTAASAPWREWAITCPS